MILYRPVSLQVLALIYDSSMKAFPARLPKQPVFYPVLELEYARKTASGWNTKNGELAGYVTQFTMEDKYIKKFEKHKVGKTQYQELWIPDDKMEEFNKHIMGHIKVVEAHFGAAFKGFIPEQFDLQGKNAVEQFTLLTNSYLYKRVDFYREIRRSHKAVFLNYPFWGKYEFKNPGLKEKILQAIKEAWITTFPQIPLPLPVQQDISLEEQPDAKAPHQQRQRDEPIQGEVLTKEEADEYEYSWDDPVNEETPPEKQIDLKPHTKHAPYEQRSDEVGQEDITQEGQADPYEQTQRVANSVREKFPPLKQPYANSLIESAPEDPPPLEEPARSNISGNATSQTATPPAQIDSHVRQGIKLGLSGKYHEAIDELSRAVEENPRDVVAHISLGVAFRRLGQDNRALASYETALKIEPIHAEAHYFRANILYQQGNVPEAITAYTVGIGLQPELIEAHQKPAPEDRLTDFTGAPAEMHRIAKSAHRILRLNRSIESDPKQADPLKERAAEYYRLRNYAQAIADYGLALILQPEDAGALYARGLAYEGLGQNNRASEDYQQAIAIQPQLADTYIQRGITFGQMGSFQQSIASLTDALRLAPKNPDVYFNRGISFFQLGDFENAILDFSMAIQLSANNEDAYYWRGASHEEARHMHQAIADYKQFLTIAQNPQARDEIEQRLIQLQGGRQEQEDHDITQDMLLAKLGRWVGRLGGVSEKRQKIDEVPSASGQQQPAIDLYELITALGERALNSIWLGNSVECDGEKSKELYALAEKNQPINGRELLAIASGIRQTLRGDFQAFEPDINIPWIIIRAWDGNGFYIETDDAQVEQQLKMQFPAMEEVEGAQPPYAALFLRI